MTQIISQLATGDIASAFGSNTLPDFAGLLGEWWLGGADGSPVVNSITGVPATLVGAPAYHDAFVTVGNPGNVQQGFTTDVGAVSSAVTIMALVRAVNDACVIAGPFNGADGFAHLNYNLIVPADATKFSAGNGARAGAFDEAVLASPDVTKFTFVMGVYLINTPSRIYLTDAGGTLMDDGAAASLPATRDNVHPVRIGAVNEVNMQGQCDVAALALIDGAKGETYAEAVYPLWKAYAEARGLTVN